ncbi:MAG: UDP-N-acetylglucosamine 2-epimerase (non-hydrolyzing) [Bacteroidetes bacterium]|nr:UDP-N-acetylglucosamine 2-epimerase (non-hydrolyzing) [Bacteroidota bacterium]
MKIVTIVGARPQFIKAAAVSREFRSHQSISEIILHTGQHYDDQMSEVFFREMDIPKPLLNLEIRSSLHGEMTGQMLAGIEQAILQEKPDAVMVYGDTNSTLAGALAAAKLQVKLIHVEAGLRSFNMAMPEEINRILTDRISNLLCCPTDHAIQNLRNEGFDHMKINVVKTGDVMQDAALFYSQRSAQQSSVMQDLPFKKFILCTLHRQENTSDSVRLKNIVEAINVIHKVIPIVLPIHPRTKKTFEAAGLILDCLVIDPVGYFDMIELIKNSTLVMTDSGGLQKEAYFFSKYCVTLRDETEWLELVENGFNKLVGADKDEIISSVRSLSDRKFESSVELYGGGHACSRIVEAIEKYI